MSRRDAQRLEDIPCAGAAIHEHLDHGDLGQGLILDAVRVRLIEIGEAVKGLDADLLASESDIHGGRSPACAICWHTGISTRRMPSSLAPCNTTCRNSKPPSPGSHCELVPRIKVDLEPGRPAASGLRRLCTHADPVTDGGKRVIVIVQIAGRAVRPITAWEE